MLEKMLPPSHMEIERGPVNEWPEDGYWVVVIIEGSH
jgi:hypothetical protein